MALVALAACGGGSDGGGLPVSDAVVDGTIEGMPIANAKAAFHAKAETPDSGIVLIGPAFAQCGQTEDEGLHLIVGIRRTSSPSTPSPQARTHARRQIC